MKKEYICALCYDYHAILELDEKHPCPKCGHVMDPATKQRPVSDMDIIIGNMDYQFMKSIRVVLAVDAVKQSVDLKLQKREWVHK